MRAPSTRRPIPGIIGSRVFMEHVVEIGVGRDHDARLRSTDVRVSRRPRYDVPLGAQYPTRFRIVIDCPRHRLTLEPRIGAKASDDVDMRGLFLTAPGSRHRSGAAKSIRVGSPAARERLRPRGGQAVTVQVERDGARHLFRAVLERAK